VKDQFDLDDLFETKLDELKEDQPAAAVPQKPVVTQTVNHPNGDAAFAPLVSSSRYGCLWPAGIATIALAVGFALGLQFASWRGADGDTVDPDVDPVDGAYVAIFYNDTDLDRYTPSQREFLNSVNTANYLEERKVNWKKIDTQPLEISALEKPFQVMSEKHRSKEPWIVIASGKKFASEPIESNDQAMKLLQKWIK
jgi:hypothetical protein